MNILDMRTIIYTGILVGGIISVLVSGGLWIQNRKRYHGLSFCFANIVLQVAASFLIALRGVIPDLMSMILSNTLVIMGALFGYIGLEQFVGKRSSQVHNYFLLAVLPFINSYFLFIHPNLSARSLTTSIILLIVCFQCLWLLLRRVEIGIRPLTRWTGLVFCAFCLLLGVRIALLLSFPDTKGDYLHLGTVESLIMIGLQMLLVLLAFSIFMMVNKRLLTDIQKQEEKFSKAFHSAPYAITLTRLSDGKVFEVNDGFTKITGYTISEILGKTTFDIHFWVYEEDRAAIVLELSQHGMVQGTELQLKKKSKEIFTGLYSAEIITINNEKCILASINDITRRKLAEEERENLITELQQALSEVKTLSGMLPICASCKKIRDDGGYWQKIESYISAHSEAKFSHSICPECTKKLYPDIHEKIYENKKD